MTSFMYLNYMFNIHYQMFNRINYMFNAKYHNLNTTSHISKIILSKFFIAGWRWDIQLNRLIDVIKVIDLTEESFIDRELVLVRVSIDAKNRSEILQIADTFQAKIDDAKKDTAVIEVTGDENKIKSFIEMIRPFGIAEVVRTGRIAMGRK